MSNYVVTFRLADKTVGGKTWNERYERLEKNLRAVDQGFWKETTSFYLVESDEDTYTFGRRIVKGLSAAEDMLFAFDPADMSACYFGDVKYADVLLSFFPNALKIG